MNLEERLKNGPRKLEETLKNTPRKLEEHLKNGLDKEHQRLKDLENRLAKLEMGGPLLPHEVIEEAKEEVAAAEHTLKMKLKAQTTSEEKFRYNVKLACRVAFWVTIFGIPTYSDYWADISFGTDRSVGVCQYQDLGRKYNIGSDEEPVLVPWTGQEPEWTAQGKQYQCGYLPDIYEGYWPTVMMMTVFTVYGGVGTTIQYGWEGMIGTFFAVLNNVIMCIIYPGGASDPDFPMWFGWLNVIGVTFLFLISNSETMTIKYGMSTHICLAMAYMSPAGPDVGYNPSGIPGVNIDSGGVCWFLTAFLGALVAILSTIFPTPLLNIKLVDDATQAYVYRATENLELSLKYLSGQDKLAKGQQINKRIQSGEDLLAEVRSNIASAWWECFDFGKFGKKRFLYNQFATHLSTTRALMYVVKRCVHEEDFTGYHTAFFTTPLVSSMNDLLLACKNIMVAISEYFEDGQLEPEQRASLQRMVTEIQDRQKHLVRTYMSETGRLRQHLCPSTSASPGTVAKDLGAEYSFMFALSATANREIRFANQFLDADKKPLPPPKMSAFKTSLKNTWSPKAMFKKEQVIYALRNLVGITITFYMGLNFTHTLFPGASYVMPMTLTLVITRVPCGTFVKSSHRLLGVVIGKVLPMEFLLLVNVFECGSVINFVWHMVTIFAFIAAFEYMYFTSPRFADLGCFAGGFSCAFLFVRCSKSDFTTTYSFRYKEVGQLACAVTIQLLVDQVFKETPARDKAIQGIEDLKVKFTAAYKKFFSGEEFLGDDYADISGAVQYLKGLLPALDPAVKMAPGWAPAFRYNLYSACIPLFETFVSDFHILTLAAGTARRKEEHEHARFFRAASKLPDGGDPVLEVLANVRGDSQGLVTMKNHLMKELSTAFDALLFLMTHPSGERVDDESLEFLRTHKTGGLDGTDAFIEEINSMTRLFENELEEESHDDVISIVKVRLQVIVESLTNAKKSLNELVDTVVVHNVNH